MAETIRYARIGKEDLHLGTGTFEVRLADGRVVVLQQVDIGTILSDASLSNRTVTLDTLTVTTLNVAVIGPPTSSLRLPEKTDPASPLSGEVWINSAGTVPEYSDDAATPAKHAFVGDDTTQTLTNKTLTSPTISGPTLSGSVAGIYTLGGTPTLGAPLAVGDNDLTGIDELGFTDAAANPTAIGRLRRNGASLVFHDGTTQKVVTLVDATQTLTNKTLAASSNQVSNVALKTATGSTTVAATVSSNVTMNDYGFCPSFTLTTDDGVNPSVLALNIQADPNDTVARVRVNNNSTTGTATIRWRYVSASDDPTMWIVYDPVTGEIKVTWCSDDPTPNEEPGVRVVGMNNIKVRPPQLTGLNIAVQHLQGADARIAAKGLNPANRLYRALQVLSDDDAPSKWLFENCKVQLPAKRIVLK